MHGSFETSLFFVFFKTTSLIFFFTLTEEFFKILLGCDEDASRLGAVGGRNDALGLHAVDQLGGTAVADLQLSLQK